MGLHDEAKLDKKFTDFAKQMNLYLNHFPKHEKYGLAQEIRRKAYECYGFIVEAQKRYHKKTALDGTTPGARHQLRGLPHLAQHPVHSQAQPALLHPFRPARPVDQRRFHSWPCAKHRQLAPSSNHPQGALP